ncbi:MAG: HWE histidine kinase domain-containing protein [Phycisphaerales bacterium]|nr:HWE histidine kinase domain-containing protein [Phycisphaerales bacterium]
MPPEHGHAEPPPPAPPAGGAMQVGILSATLIWLVFVVLLAALLLWRVGEHRLHAQELQKAEQLGSVALSVISGIEDPIEVRGKLRTMRTASPQIAVLELASPDNPPSSDAEASTLTRVVGQDGRELVVGIATDAASRDRLWSTLGALISLGTVFLLMSIFLVVVIGRLVGRPIRQLEQQAARLADGKIDSSVAGAVPGDFEALTRSLERIGARMQSERDQNERIGEELQRTNSLQGLMLRELNHRIRNNLASLTALVSISRTQESTVSEFAKRIERRIEAMAAVHGMLSERNWSPVALLDLLERLQPLELGERIKLIGPDIDVGAAQATPLAMVLQEMFANALEHGSLGSGAGWLQVQWDIGEAAEGEIIVINWRETGGPSPNPTAAAGTGTTLIRGLIEGELRGDVSLNHTPDGVSHRIRIPLKPGTQVGST